ncbi:hypothetical protein F4X88_15600 [Candidatus Poribacteria bacterium]|nr:hypothetical protein [Candidatus Poribacteria bacterium]MYA57711.1 hypothetical protein [Candidatus Poribacteria bacterium]
MLKRNWHWALGALILIGVGGFMFLRPTTSPEPIKIYRTVTPAPKRAPTTETKTEKTDIALQYGHLQDHSHGDSHETGPHSHAAETNTHSDEYDWRDDSVFDVTPPKNDPWGQTHPVSEPTKAADDTYPPRDWYKTEDPELRAEYLYAQFIKQFGDTPEVQAIGDYELKVARGIPPTLEEYTHYLEAHYHLFPNQHNRQTLDNLRKAIASGNAIIFE